MQDAQPVSFVHRLADLVENNNRLVERHGPPVFQPLGESLDFEIFHHQVGSGLVAVAGAYYPEIDDGDDVRMAQQSDGLRLAAQPLDEFAVAGQLRRNDFNGDATASANVSLAIDRAHSPTAAKRFDLVLSIEQLADYVIRPGGGFSGEGLQRVNDLSLPSSESPEEALSERRIIKKAIVLLVRGDQRLNFALERRIVLTGARGEFLTPFICAFHSFVYLLDDTIPVHIHIFLSYIFSLVGPGAGSDDRCHQRPLQLQAQNESPYLSPSRSDTAPRTSARSAFSDNDYRG